MKYRVIFSGKCAEGREEEEVRREVGRVFKLDEAGTAKLFSGKKMVINKNVDLETANKFQQAMARCGATSTIEEIAEKPVNSIAPPVREEAASEPGPGPAPVAEPVPESGAGPQSGPEESAKPVSQVAHGPEPGRSLEADDKLVPDYKISIKGMLGEAWRLTSGAKGTILGGWAVVMLISVVINICAVVLLAILGLPKTTQMALSMAIQLTVTIGLYPFIAGVIMIGVKRASGLPISYKMIFYYFSYMVPVVIASFLVLVMSSIGFMLLLAPGIYLSLAYVLVVPLIVDRNMGAWQAMEASRRAISRHWFKVFGLYFVMGLIVTVSAIPFGLGMIWTMPMFVILQGILFREIFGRSEGSASTEA